MNIPKLRFNGFSDEWEEVISENLFDNISEKNTNNETVLTILQGKGTIPRAESGRSIQYMQSSVSKYKRVEKNDFIIHLRSFEGGLEVANSRGAVSPAYTILRSKEKFNIDFYKNYFRTNKFINQVLSSAVEGVRDGRQISYNKFKNIKITTTTFAEQEKIGNFLATLDEKKQVEKDILENLINIKKGYIQKIFSQEVRFDGFGDEWEECSIRDISIYKTSTISAKTFNNFGEDEIYPLYGAEGIVRYINFYQNDVKSICIIKDGAGVGRVCLCEEKSSVLGTMGVMLSNNRSYVEWLYYRLYLINFDKYKCGSTIPHIYYKDYSQETILLPSLAEQKKIADFLTTLDERIKNQSEIIDKISLLKKGLLQQLFC